jgi:hypothetical protein
VDALTLESENRVASTTPPMARNRSSSLAAQLESLNVVDGRASLTPEPRDHRRSSRMNRGSNSPAVATCHRVEDERPPNSSYYDTSFQSALAKSKDLAKRFAEVLSSSDLHQDETSAIQALYSQACDARDYLGPRSWRIGFVGDSAAGEP